MSIPTVSRDVYPADSSPTCWMAAPVGLVPFVMDGIRVGAGGPRLPASRFPETNVRTYVVGPDGGLLLADISHEPWPLRTARLVSLDDGFLSATGYRLDGRAPSHMVHGGSVDVQVSRPRRVD